MSNFNESKGFLISNDDNNACAPIAVSIVTGVPIDVVLKVFESAGRVKGQDSPNEVIGKAIDVLGFKVFGMKVKSETIEEVEEELKARKPIPCIIDLEDHWSAWDGEKVDDFIRGTQHKISGNIFYLVPKTFDSNP